MLAIALSLIKPANVRTRHAHTISPGTNAHRITAIGVRSDARDAARNLIDYDNSKVGRGRGNLAFDLAALLRERGGKHHEDASGGHAESPVALKMTAHHVPT